MNRLSHPTFCLSLSLCLWWGLMLCAPALAARHDGVVRVGGDHNYPPYEFLNAEGQPDGYNTELTRAIADVMGIKVEIQLGDWDSMRKRLETGELDVLQGLSFSAGRRHHYDFSPPHALVHQSIFARRHGGQFMAHRGTPQVMALAQLAGKEVIVQRGGVMHDYLLAHDVGARLVLVDTHANALRLLASGQHDYALIANLPGLYLGRELALSNLVALGQPISPQRYGYAVNKGQAELLAQFSEGLAILKNTGRQQAIYDKWLGPLEGAGRSWKQLGLVAAVIATLLLLVTGCIVVWNRMLSREVASRTRELALRQQQLIQADKMTSLGILVSGVAHEINNPSSLLLLNLPLLKEAYQDIEEILEQHYQEQGDFYLAGLAYSRMRDELPAMLDDMLAGSQRIRRIVEDLRDFARQKPADLSEIVSLNAVLATAIRLTDNSIRSACHHFQVSYGEDLPPLRGNAQRIEQVIINLIVNACQSLDSPDRPISVRTGYEPKTGMLHLDVQDQGCGIAPENLARLSDPFFTTKREQGGTGLGLSISTTIVQEHGGHLRFASAPGKGTCATLSLPALQGDPSS